MLSSRSTAVRPKLDVMLRVCIFATPHTYVAPLIRLQRAHFAYAESSQQGRGKRRSAGSTGEDLSPIVLISGWSTDILSPLGTYFSASVNTVRVHGRSFCSSEIEIFLLLDPSY